jgi:hypothetical protein
MIVGFPDVHTFPLSFRGGQMPEYLIGFSYHEPEPYALWQRGSSLPLRSQSFGGRCECCMSLDVFLEFVNLFCAGLLAGAEFVVYLGVRSPITVLEEQPQIQLRQALIRRLRVLVPAVYLLTLLSAIAVAVLAGTGDGFAFQCMGLLAIFVWSLTTFLGTVPINKATLRWRPDAPPADWRSVVSRWERLDTVRFWAAVIAFAFFLTAVAVQLR